MTQGRALSWLALGVGMICGLSAAGLVPQPAAAAPWDKLMSSNRIEADPQKSYAVDERNGPWQIMACSFSGPYANQQAQDLVIELRKRYKLPAYTYEKKFDLGKDLPGLGVDAMNRPRKMKYVRGRSEIDEIAVLVGDYPSVDAPEAQETLRKLRYDQPDCLKLTDGKPTARTLAGWRLFQTSLLSPSNEKQERGPMGFAFITTNPVLPKEFFVAKGVDELVLKSNEGVEHCLLDCPGKLTVQVATFTGRVIIDQKEILAASKVKDKDTESQLGLAAYKAHRLTEALRIKGYEAYEFHDRYASIVTVGSFQTEGWPGPDGRIQLAPEIQAVIDQFKAERKATAQNPTGVPIPQKIIEISLDPQPHLVYVPKRPTSSLLRRENVKVTRLP